MLSHLHVTDFTLVKELSLDFSKGLTVLTGETGAGKSILLGALGLALGDRADADKIRAGAEKTEVSASFEVENLVFVKSWLSDADLGCDECIIRRVVTIEGRSRAYVNGQLVTLAQLRELGALLVDIHSQHEHQSLLKITTHRTLLDSFGQMDDLLDEVKQKYSVWKAISAELEKVKHSHEELNARFQLLSYQRDELDQLNVAEGESAELEEKQKQIANLVELQMTCQQVSGMCTLNEGSISEQLSRCLQLVSKMPVKSKTVEQVEEMLNTALIQVDEASSELQRDMDVMVDDSISLEEIEERLSAIYDVARKHRISPEAISTLHQSLCAELAEMRSGDEQLEVLLEREKSSLSDYHESAKLLSAARTKAAVALAKAVNKQIASLSMSHARFEVGFTTQALPSKYGNEVPEFLISTVPGQPARPLAKVASGGELSRISLSIQVVAAKTSLVPIMVFDEVDVGIGGETGDVVGRLLRTLGESAQVLCVTHLAQVASKAHHHLKVEKTVSKKGASTEIHSLLGDDKVSEIARMMGGIVESEQSIAHAREMLEA